MYEETTWSLINHIFVFIFQLKMHDMQTQATSFFSDNDILKVIWVATLFNYIVGAS